MVWNGRRGGGGDYQFLKKYLYWIEFMSYYKFQFDCWWPGVEKILKETKGGCDCKFFKKFYIE